MRKAYFWILLCVLPLTLGAQTPESLFEQANRAYSDGNYEQALALYRQIENQGMVSGELYYNMGNTCYRLNQLGPARLYYERALRLMPGDEALLYNMELLKMRLTDRIKTPPQLFLIRWWRLLSELLSVHVWGMVSIVLFAMLLLALAFYFYKKNRSESFPAAPLRFLALLWLVTLIIWLEKTYLDETTRFAVIMRSSVTVYAEPADDSTELFLLHEGAKVELEQQMDDWRRIRLKDGKTGWLPVEFIEEI